MVSGEIIHELESHSCQTETQTVYQGSVVPYLLASAGLARENCPYHCPCECLPDSPRTSEIVVSLEMKAVRCRRSTGQAWVVLPGGVVGPDLFEVGVEEFLIRHFADVQIICFGDIRITPIFVIDNAVLHNNSLSVTWIEYYKETADVLATHCIGIKLIFSSIRPSLNEAIARSSHRVEFPGRRVFRLYSLLVPHYPLFWPL